jgi:hypothetical protein
MLEIKKNVTFLILFGFSLVLLPRANAMDYSLNINFDKVKPLETVTLLETIPVTLTPEKVDGFQVEVSESLTGVQHKQILPSSRMRIMMNGQPFQLTNSPVTVIFANQNKTADRINLAIELRIKSEDRADSYSGKIILKTWNNGVSGKVWNNSIAINLTAVIQPWFKIQCDSDQMVLDQVSYSQARLVNPEPLQLRIASNSNWVLTCNIANSKCELHPMVRIISGQTPHLQVINSNSVITVNRHILASGTATARNGRYWLELGIGIEIRDVIKYAAKEYTIPIQFNLLLRDDKSDIP